MNKITASFLILCGSASFGILSPLVKTAYRHGFTTAEVTGSQLIFGCLGLWILSVPYLGELRKYSWKTLSKLIVSGLFAGLTSVFYYLALQTVSAALAVVLLFQFIWIGMLVDWCIWKRKPTRNHWIALIVIVAGTILASGYQALMSSSLDLSGICLALLAACSYVGNINVSGHVATEVPAVLRGSLMMTGATIITLIIFPPTFLFNGALGQGLWIWGIVIALFGVVIPPYLYAKGVPIVGTGLATILAAVELPVVITLSAFVLLEKINILQWAGVIMILIGIFISESVIDPHLGSRHFLPPISPLSKRGNRGEKR